MKSNGCRREEIFVSILGIIVLLSLTIIGIVQDKTKVEEPLVLNETSSSIQTNKERFEFEYGETIPTNISYYLKDVDENVWNSDIEKVNSKKLGMYEVRFNNSKVTKKITVRVVDKIAPKFICESEEINWVLEKDETVEDLIAGANIKAMDNVDGDLSAYIGGWPKELPTSAQKVTYTLQVRDRSMNVSSKKITVNFMEP